MRIRLLAFLPLLAAPAVAQEARPAALTGDDYARAERFLAQHTTPLVSGVPGRPTWLPDGRFWYRVSVAGGAEFILVDPARRRRAPAFDHARLAEALSAATGRSIEAAALPFQRFDLSRDGRTLTVSVTPSAPMAPPGDGGRWRCDLRAYLCSADTTAPGAPHDPPPAASTSPDGTKAVFIREHNLWVRDLTTGQDRQLTADGVEDFGYATNNAGWTKSDAPVVSWSPDSRKVATFQHDSAAWTRCTSSRRTSGAPRLEAWKYPLPGRQRDLPDQPGDDRRRDGPSVVAAPDAAGRSTARWFRTTSPAGRHALRRCSGTRTARTSPSSPARAITRPPGSAWRTPGPARSARCSRSAPRRRSATPR
jgi:hypothetical protein